MSDLAQPTQSLIPEIGEAETSDTGHLELSPPSWADHETGAGIDVVEELGNQHGSTGSASTTTPVKGLLADFWGADWPAIEAEARAMGNDDLLDYEIPPEDMPVPWDEVEGQLFVLLAAAIDKAREGLPMTLGATERVPWPSSLTVKFLAEQSGLGVREEELTEELLKRATDVTADLTWEIDREANNLVDAYHEVCKNLVRNHRYGLSHYLYMSSVEKAQLSKNDLDRPRWTPLMLIHGGWLVSIHVFKDENLTLQQMSEEMRPLYVERFRLLRDVFR